MTAPNPTGQTLSADEFQDAHREAVEAVSRMEDVLDVADGEAPKQNPPKSRKKQLLLAAEVIRVLGGAGWNISTVTGDFLLLKSMAARVQSVREAAAEAAKEAGLPASVARSTQTAAERATKGEWDAVLLRLYSELTQQWDWHLDHLDEQVFGPDN